MAFDHGSSTFIPINILLVIHIAWLWSKLISGWIIVPIAIGLILMGTDKYVGMVITFILAIVDGMSIGLTERLAAQQITQNSTVFQHELAIAITAIFMVIGFMLGIGWLLGYFLERKYSKTTDKTINNDKI